MTSSAKKFQDRYNLYELLGIENFSDPRAVREAYRSLALRHHPDRAPECSQSAGKFILGAKAYGILNDPEEKERYDRRLKARLKKAGAFENREYRNQLRRGTGGGFSQRFAVDPEYNRFIDECRSNFREFLNNLDRIKPRPKLIHPRGMEAGEYEDLVTQGREGFQSYLDSLPRVRLFKR